MQYKCQTCSVLRGTHTDLTENRTDLSFLPALSLNAKFFEQSFFKIFLRFYMGVLDMLNLIALGMFGGALSMLGAVFCSARDFIYVKGSLVFG